MFIEAARIRLINPHQRNIALLMIGLGARNAAAAFLTTLARNPTITPSATRTGSGRPKTSAARSHVITMRLVAISVTITAARKTNFGEPHAFKYLKLEAEDLAVKQV